MSKQKVTPLPEYFYKKMACLKNTGLNEGFGTHRPFHSFACTGFWRYKFSSKEFYQAMRSQNLNSSISKIRFKQTMLTYDPAEVSHSEFHRMLVGGVAPRPIALVSSMDRDGTSNLSPFSFFNVFGVNPAVLCFSPAYSGKTGNPKHTMLNIDETGECTVSIVTYEMVHQISLASAPYERGVDEFLKSGLTKRPSIKVTPPGVAESPFIMEAKLLHHLDFGHGPGSGNMMVCEIVMLHVNESVLKIIGIGDASYRAIDPLLMDQVARMGGPYYTRAREGLFMLPQPSRSLAGIDRLPEDIRASSVLTGKHLAQLASVTEIPQSLPPSPLVAENYARHVEAKLLLDQGDVEGAWKVLT
jgi:flavin reductase (DIM6/NTAB) family NADH-FMN oxidoreductase RutF